MRANLQLRSHIDGCGDLPDETEARSPQSDTSATKPWAVGPVRRRPGGQSYLRRGKWPCPVNPGSAVMFALL